ncbi:hypothetical protein HY490_00735 [Candidatus Woesearchaeota archaeon]|nr:hypothetical protein [Candidatus Woesearchaeota archaeon]
MTLPRSYEFEVDEYWVVRNPRDHKQRYTSDVEFCVQPKSGIELPLIPGDHQNYGICFDAIPDEKCSELALEPMEVYGPNVRAHTIFFDITEDYGRLSRQRLMQVCKVAGLLYHVLIDKPVEERPPNEWSKAFYIHATSNEYTIDTHDLLPVEELTDIVNNASNISRVLDFVERKAALKTVNEDYIERIVTILQDGLEQFRRSTHFMSIDSNERSAIRTLCDEDATHLNELLYQRTLNANRERVLRTLKNFAYFHDLGDDAEWSRIEEIIR